MDELTKTLNDYPLWLILMVVANECRNRSCAVAHTSDQAQDLARLAGQLDVTAHSIKHEVVKF